MNALKEIREAKGMSQTKLADVSGITRQRINKIESDPNANVTTETIQKLANALGVEASEIFFT